MTGLFHMFRTISQRESSIVQLMNVYASEITPTTISYLCPECWTGAKGRTYTTDRTKDGRIIRSRKPTVHRHGNAFSERKDRIETRTSHCIHAKLRDIVIIIDKFTKRKDFPKEPLGTIEEEVPLLIEPKTFVRVPMVEGDIM